jgi:hypothetical protein
MSDANLLIFGCAVTFIAVAGAYVYLRESFVGQQVSPATRARERGRELRRHVA